MDTNVQFAEEARKIKKALEFVKQSAKVKLAVAQRRVEEVELLLDINPVEIKSKRPDAWQKLLNMEAGMKVIEDDKEEFDNAKKEQEIA